jgi:hypothetical protein
MSNSKKDEYKMRNSFHFMMNFYSSHLGSLNLKFSDKKLEKEYKEMTFTSKKVALVILSIVFIILMLTNLLQVVISGQPGATGYIIFVPMYAFIILMCTIIILLSYFLKKNGLCFKTLKIIFLILVLISQLTTLIFYTSTKATYLNYARNIFFLITTIYFSVNIFFDFSIFRVVIVNILMIGVIIAFYVLLDLANIATEVLYLLACMFYFEFYGFMKDKSQKLIFLEQKQKELLSNYFFGILTQMNVGLAIIKEEEFVFMNDKFTSSCNEILREEKNVIDNQKLNTILNLIKVKGDEIEKDFQEIVLNLEV